MKEHEDALWRVETSHKDSTLSMFHVLACCLTEAADKAQVAIGEDEVVVSIEMGAPLLVDEDGDEVELPPSAADKDKAVEVPVAVPVAGRN